MSDAPQPPDEPSAPPPVPAGGWAAPTPPPPAPPAEPEPGQGWQQPPPPPPDQAPPPPVPPSWGPPPTQQPPAPAPPPPTWAQWQSQSQQALPPQWTPAPAYRPPVAVPGPRPAPSTAGPRLYVALALVGAGAAVIIAVLVSILTIDAGDFTFLEFTFANRLQSGTSYITLPVVLLLPLALLLAHDPGPAPAGGPGPGEGGLSRTVVVGATVLGAAFSVLTVVRLGANLTGNDLFVTTSTAAAIFFDLACLMVAVASTIWAYRLLPANAPPAPEPERQEGSPWAPPTLPPQGPPQAPPLVPGWPPPSNN